MSSASDEWLGGLFRSALQGADNEGLVRAAYEVVLGYEDASAMTRAGARLDYWESRLDGGDLTAETFLPAFLDEAATNQGAFVPDADHAGNTAVVAAQRDASDVLRGLTEGALPASPGGVLEGLIPEAVALRAEGGSGSFDLSGLPALDVRINGIEAGAVGESVRIEAGVLHAGGGEVDVTVSQGQASGTATATLDASPGLEIIEQGFDTRELDAGRLGVSVASAGDTSVAVEQTFGIYEDLFDRGLNLQWRDPTSSPFETVGRMIVDQADSVTGTFNVGTGFMISPQHVMTNAHVLGDGGFSTDLESLSQVEFLPGPEIADGVTAASTAIMGVEAHALQAEFRDEWPGGDLGIVRLEEPVMPDNEPALFDWFWHDAADPARDVVGAEVQWAGFPSDGIAQGGELFQWGVDATVTGTTGDEGGLLLDAGARGAGGASGSPVFRETDAGAEFLGTFTGSLGDEPAVAGLDARAHDWALTILRNDGFGEDRDFVDGPLDADALGPFAELTVMDDSLIA